MLYNFYLAFKIVYFKTWHFVPNVTYHTSLTIH